MSLIAHVDSCIRQRPCARCHDWIFKSLSGDAVWRRTKSDSAFFVSFEVGLCKGHDEEERAAGLCCVARTVNRCFGGVIGRRASRYFQPVTVTLGLTHDEVGLLRKMVGAGVFSGAPANIHDSNLFLGTYKIPKSSGMSELERGALEQVFSYLGGLLSRGYGNSDQRYCWDVVTQCPRDLLACIGFRSCVKQRDTVGRLAGFEPRHRPGVHAGSTLHRPVAPPAGYDEQPDTGDAPPPAPRAGDVGGPKPDPGTPPDASPAVPTDVLCPGPVPASQLHGVKMITDPDHWQHGAIAVQFLPAIEERLFYLTSLERVKQAIKGRIVDPLVPVTLSDADRRDLKANVDAFLDYMRSDKDHFMQIATTTLFGGYKSKKWVLSRALVGLERLRMRFNPRYRFSGSIKLEPSKGNKPPRLLIADGDEGQIMAWLLLATLEKWIFSRYKKRSIKGRSRGAAMAMLHELLAQHVVDMPQGVREADAPLAPVSIVENDGSAWDACMSADLRAMTENRVMDLAASFLSEILVPWSPQTFTDARLDSNALPTLELRVHSKPLSAYSDMENRDIEELQMKGKDFKLIIRAIRRSGCRGTSVLNWLGNFLCWCFVIAGADGKDLILPRCTRVRCRDGIVRYVRMVFEGDDSILSFMERNGVSISDRPEFMRLLNEYWTKLGHRPKLHHRQKVAEFCGYHFEVGKFGLTGIHGPDLRRQLVQAAFCANSAAVEAALSGDARAFGKAVGPGLISRAYQLATSYPSFARVLFNIGLTYLHGSEPLLTRDDVYALDLDEVVLPPQYAAQEDDSEVVILKKLEWEQIIPRVERHINVSLVAGQGGLEEADIAHRLGAVDEPGDWYSLMDTVICLRPGVDETMFKESVNHWLSSTAVR